MDGMQAEIKGDIVLMRTDMGLMQAEIKGDIVLMRTDMGLMQAEIKGLGHTIKITSAITLSAIVGVAIALIFYLLNAADERKTLMEILANQPVAEITRPVAETTQPNHQKPSN